MLKHTAVLKAFSKSKLALRSSAIFGVMLLAFVMAGIGAYNPGVAHATPPSGMIWTDFLNTRGCPWYGYGTPQTIRQGGNNDPDCVRILQHFLNEWNVVKLSPNDSNYNWPTNQLWEDGVFGPATTVQVKTFQDYARYFSGTALASDGVVGPATWYHMTQCMNGGMHSVCHRNAAPGA